MSDRKRRKLNFRFHDPNPPEVAAQYILGLLIEANAAKVENEIRKAGETGTIAQTVLEDHPA